MTLHPSRPVWGYDEFEITPPVLTSSITFTVESMYGTPGDTGFAEIEIYSKPRKISEQNGTSRKSTIYVRLMIAPKLDRQIDSLQMLGQLFCNQLRLI